MVLTLSEPASLLSHTIFKLIALQKYDNSETLALHHLTITSMSKDTRMST